MHRTHYTVRRVGLRSVARLACALGWLVALCPAVALAGAAVEALRAADRVLGRVQPVEITLLGQVLARFDLLEILRLRAAAQAIGQLAGTPLLTFAGLALGLVLLGGLGFVIVALLAGSGYNLLAATGWGLQVELEPARDKRDGAQVVSDRDAIQYLRTGNGTQRSVEDNNTEMT